MTDERERLREALERLLRGRSRGGAGLGFNADMHEEAVVDAILADPDVVAALAHDRASGSGLRGVHVHAAWRDGMLAQGREVAPERMAWDTLTQQDRDLDDGIAAALSGSSDPEAGGLPSEAEFERAIQAAYDQHDDHRTRHPGHSGACQDDWPSAWRLASLVRRALTEAKPETPDPDWVAIGEAMAESGRRATELNKRARAKPETPA
jgi:hypothetical protein